MTTTWYTSLWAQPWTQQLLWTLLAGSIGLLWGLGELVGAFKNETGRSLRTGGGWVAVPVRVGRKKEARAYLLQAAALFEEIGFADYAERHRRAAA